MKKNVGHVPVLSVVIVNYNHKYFPRMALSALEASKTDFPFEIIFVDNASKEDESVQFLKKAEREKRIILIESKKNVGFGAGNNLGFEKMKGEYVFIHNPDVTVTEDALQKMVDYLEAHPDVGLLGPKLVYYNGAVQESCRRFMTFTDLIIKRTFLHHFEPWKSRFKTYLMHDFDHNKVQEVDLITGAAMMGRTDFLWRYLGGFDKRYFLFMEDFDLCQRVHQAGKKVVYYPEVALLHYHKRLSGGSFFGQFFKRVFWLHLASSFKYFRRWRRKR